MHLKVDKMLTNYTLSKHCFLFFKGDLFDLEDVSDKRLGPGETHCCHQSLLRIRTKIFTAAFSPVHDKP